MRYCKNCEQMTETLDGFYYQKCSKCYRPKPKQSNQWIINIAVLLGIVTILLMALSSATISITPFASNPSNGSTVNTRYVSLGWNITTNETLSSIIFNWNNTNYSLYDDNLILFWNFDNRSVLGENSTYVVDISKQGRFNYSNTDINLFNLTSGYKNLGFYTSNKSGTSKTFSSVDFNSSSAYSICFYAKFYSDVDNVYQNTLYLRGATNSNKFGFYIDNATEKMNLEIWDNAGNLEANGRSMNKVSTGLWNHYCGTINDTNLNLYMNGELIESDILASNEINLSNASRLLYVYSDFNGVLDDIRIYNKSLFGEDVKLLYNSILIKYNMTDYELSMNQSFINTKHINTILTASSQAESTRKLLTFYHNFITTLVYKSTTIGNRNPIFFGANSHTSWFSQYTTLYETHRQKFLDTKMTHTRRDIGLDGIYYGFYNGGFEYWTNLSVGNFTSNVNSGARSWTVVRDDGTIGRVEATTDARTGTYAFNLTHVNGSGTVWMYTDIILKNNTYYNISVWMKGNGSIQVFRNHEGPWANLSSGGTINTTTWRQASVIINTSQFTEYANQTWRIGVYSVGPNEWVTIDDFEIQETGSKKDIWWDLSTYNWNRQIESIEWFAQNNITAQYIIAYMPNDFANFNFTECNASKITDCYPRNETLFTEIVLDWINKVTNNSKNNMTIELELWNEPYGSTFMSNLSIVNRIKWYNRLFNITYQAIHSKYPDMKIGGPSGYQYSPEDVWLYQFIGNFSNYSNVITTIHNYGATGEYSNSYDAVYYKNKDAFANCTYYGVTCDISWGEFNLDHTTNDDLIKNTTSRWGEWQTNIAGGYIAGLNYFPTNTRFDIYHWSDNHTYSVGYAEYPRLWYMFSDVNHDNRITPPYWVTANFTRYTAGTIYNSTSDNVPVKVVASKIGSTCSLVIDNMENDYQNISLSFPSSCGSQLIDVSTGTLYRNGSTIIQEPYVVSYLTTPTITSSAGYTIYSNYFGEELKRVVIQTSDATCNTIIEQYGEFGTYFAIIGLAVVFIIILGVLGISGRIDTKMLVSGVLGLVLSAILIIVGINLQTYLCQL